MEQDITARDFLQSYLALFQDSLLYIVYYEQKEKS